MEFCKASSVGEFAILLRLAKSLSLHETLLSLLVIQRSQACSRWNVQTSTWHSEKQKQNGNQTGKTQFVTIKLRINGGKPPNTPLFPLLNRSRKRWFDGDYEKICSKKSSSGGPASFLTERVHRHLSFTNFLKIHTYLGLCLPGNNDSRDLISSSHMSVIK